MAKQNSKDNKDLTPEELAAKAEAEAAEKEAADKAAAEAEAAEKEAADKAAAEAEAAEKEAADKAAAEAEAAEKEAADKAAAEVESNAKFKGELFSYKGRKYAVNKSVPTFSIGGKVYTTEELPGKLKLVAQLIDLGFAGLVEVK